MEDTDVGPIVQDQVVVHLAHHQEDQEVVDHYSIVVDPVVVDIGHDYIVLVQHWVDHHQHYFANHLIKCLYVTNVISKQKNITK